MLVAYKYCVTSVSMPNHDRVKDQSHRSEDSCIIWTAVTLDRSEKAEINTNNFPMGTVVCNCGKESQMMGINSIHFVFSVLNSIN